MKKFLLLSAFICSFTCMKAQSQKGEWSLVPMAGANLMISEPLDALVGATVGVGIDWQASKWVAISSGLLYSYQRYGLKEPFNTPGIYQSQDGSFYDDPVRDGRLEIPLTVSAYVWKGLALKAGIQTSYRLHSGMVDHHEDMENVMGYSLTMTRDIISTGTAMHEFYFSLPLAISYEYRKFIIDVRYIFGLQNLRARCDRTLETSYNMTAQAHAIMSWDDQKVNKLQITLGYRFGL